MSVAFELDHVGVGARDLAPLATAYERLGFTLTPTARHRGKATGNRCIMLDHGYIELIALIDPSMPDKLQAQLDRYAGLHIIALGIEDSDATLDRLRRAGLDIAGITPLERPVDDADPTGLQARFERIPLPDAPEGGLAGRGGARRPRPGGHCGAVLPPGGPAGGARPGCRLRYGDGPRPGSDAAGRRFGPGVSRSDRARVALHRRHDGGDAGWMCGAAADPGRHRACRGRRRRAGDARSCRRCCAAVHLTPPGRRAR